MGCMCSKASSGPPPPNILYSNLSMATHAHMLENVDLRKLRKLVKSGRLAPLYPHDLAQPDAAEECPICTVAFPSLNTSSCCAARVCTECFMYHQTSADPPGKATCPFCKRTPFAVRYLGVTSKEVLQREADERQAWAAAQARRKQQDTPLVQDNNSSSGGGGSSSTTAATAAGASQASQQQQQQPQQQQQHPSWQQQHPPVPGSSNRAVEAISVYAGYHTGRHSSNGGSNSGNGGSGGDAAQAQDTTQPPSQQEQHQQDQQQRHQQQQRLLQQQLERASQLLELQLQQVAELRELHHAGLLPGYAASELGGLALEELDEILLEQALLESLQDAHTDADAGVPAADATTEEAAPAAAESATN